LKISVKRCRFFFFFPPASGFANTECIVFGATPDGIDGAMPLLSPRHAAKSAAVKHAAINLYDRFML
jgi:hypothetical protein